VYETGYYGIPGTCRVTQVHLILGGRPVCGYRPAKSQEFQWCAHGIQLYYLECPRCRERAKKYYLKLARLADKVRGQICGHV
jgi:hypothetical protein